MEPLAESPAATSPKKWQDGMNRFWTIAKRYTRELPDYWRGGRDCLESLSEGGSAARPNELRTYLPPDTPNSDHSRVLDLSMACALGGQRNNRGVPVHRFTLRDAGDLRLGAGLGLAVALVFWLALNDLLFSRPPAYRREPPPTLSSSQKAILYGFPMVVFIGLLYEGLRRNLASASLGTLAGQPTG